MGRYFLKRIFWATFTVIVVSFIVFMAMSMSAGDPAELILGAKATDAQKVALREELGLNRPAIVQYVDYMSGLFRGDFGVSYNDGRPIGEKILSALPYTLTFGGLLILTLAIVATPLGVYMAIKQYSFVDNLTTVIILFMTAIPGFVIGLIMLKVFAADLGWFPIQGGRSAAGYVMPVAAGFLPALGPFTRYIKSVTLQALGSDYIRTARAKGVSVLKTYSKHLFRNIIIPILTIYGISIAGMFGGSVVLESLFSIPGIGMLSVRAVATKDMPMVMGCVIMMATAFTFVTLLVDLSYSFFDPRIKAEYKNMGRRKARV